MSPSGNVAHSGLLILAATTVIAIGATGVGLLLPPAQLDARASRLVQLAGAAALTIGVIWLYLGGKQLETRRRGVPDAAGAALFRAGSIMAVLALIATLTSPLAVETEPEAGVDAAAQDVPLPDAFPGNEVPSQSPSVNPSGRGSLGASADPRMPGPSAGSNPGSGEFLGFNWRLSRRMQNLIFMVLILGFLALRFLGPKRRIRLPGWALALEGPNGSGTHVEEAQTFLAELPPQGGAPRQRITRAYYRLLEALRAADAPRHPHEGPHEHLIRTLVPLGVKPTPMHRLTDLYVMAEFSPGPVTEQNVVEADQALGASLTAIEPMRAGSNIESGP